MPITVKQTQHVCLPAGVYPAQVSNIEDADGQYGPQLKFTFDLLGEHQGKQLTGWTSKSFNVKSKLYEWTQGMLGGIAIDPEWDFSSDAVMGKKVLLTVLKKAGDNGSEFNRIDNVLPAPRPKAKAKAAPPPPDEDGPYDDEPPF